MPRAAIVGLSLFGILYVAAVWCSLAALRHRPTNSARGGLVVFLRRRRPRREDFTDHGWDLVQRARLLRALGLLAMVAGYIAA